MTRLGLVGAEDALPVGRAGQDQGLVVRAWHGCRTRGEDLSFITVGDHQNLETSVFAVFAWVQLAFKI